MGDIRKCEKCGRSFEAIVVGGGMTSPEPEPLVCPHCGFKKMELSSGRFVTRPTAADKPPAG